MLHQQSQLPTMPELSSTAQSTCSHRPCCKSDGKIMNKMFAALDVSKCNVLNDTVFCCEYNVQRPHQVSSMTVYTHHSKLSSLQ